jgi:hypothetical protein
MEQLIKLFQEYLAGWSWEEWQAAGSSDKEEIVVNAIADLGPSMNIDVEEAYDIFYDWAAGLTESDFALELTEANGIVQRFANSSSYSGYASGLGNISTRIVPGPNAARTKEDIKLRDKCLKAAQKAIATGPEAVELYNRGYWSRTWRLNNFCPAIDPDTLELVYDPDRKNVIYQQASSAYFKRQDEYRTNYEAKRKLNNIE